MALSLNRVVGLVVAHWVSAAAIGLSMQHIDHFGPGLLGLAVAFPAHVFSGVVLLFALFDQRQLRRWLVMLGLSANALFLWWIGRDAGLF